MKHAIAANFLKKTFTTALFFGLAFSVHEVSFAKLNRAQQFEAVDDDTVVEETVEEAPVRRLPRRQIRRRVVSQETEDAPVVPATNGAIVQSVNVGSAGTSSQQTASSNTAQVTAQGSEDSFGSKLSKKIDSKLDAQRRLREEEVRRQNREDEDRLVNRIDKALTDEPAAHVADAQDYRNPQKVIVVEHEDNDVGIESHARAENSSSLGHGITLSPMVGAAMMKNDIYDISTATDLGVSLDLNLDDNLALTLGYTYAKYNVGLSANGSAYNGFNNYYSQQNPTNTYLNNNLNTLEYKQNIIDAGFKYKLLERDSRFRPYLGAGVGYMMGSLNYSQNSVNTFSQNPFNTPNGSLANNSYNTDYTINDWLGYLQAGLLLNFSETFGIGANYRYYKVLSSSQNSNLNNYAFVANGRNQRPAPTDRDFVSGSLKDSDFQTINFSLNLTF